VRPDASANPPEATAAVAQSVEAREEPEELPSDAVEAPAAPTSGKSSGSNSPREDAKETPQDCERIAPCEEPVHDAEGSVSHRSSCSRISHRSSSYSGSESAGSEPAVELELPQSAPASRGSEAASAPASRRSGAASAAEEGDKSSAVPDDAASHRSLEVDVAVHSARGSILLSVMTENMGVTGEALSEDGSRVRTPSTATEVPRASDAQEAQTLPLSIGIGPASSLDPVHERLGDVSADIELDDEDATYEDDFEPEDFYEDDFESFDASMSW